MAFIKAFIFHQVKEKICIKKVDNIIIFIQQENRHGYFPVR